MIQAFNTAGESIAGLVYHLQSMVKIVCPHDPKKRSEKFGHMGVAALPHTILNAG